MLPLAPPAELAAAREILDPDRAVVSDAEFPERDLEVGGLRVVRIEADHHEDNVAAVGAGLGIVEDRIVVSGEKPRVEVGLQRRVAATQTIEQSDVGDDVAGLVAALKDKGLV